MKKIVIILGIVIVVGAISIVFLSSRSGENLGKTTQKESKGSQSEEANIPIDRETFPVGDNENVKFEGKTISIDVAKDIVLTENGDPKCVVLIPEGENPDADTICDAINNQ